MTNKKIKLINEFEVKVPDKGFSINGYFEKFHQKLEFERVGGWNEKMFHNLNYNPGQMLTFRFWDIPKDYKSEELIKEIQDNPASAWGLCLVLQRAYTFIPSKHHHLFALDKKTKLFFNENESRIYYPLIYFDGMFDNIPNFKLGDYSKKVGERYSSFAAYLSIK